MTTTLETPAAAPPVLPGFVRRHRTSLLLGLALVAAVVVAVVLGAGPETSTPMDPDNPGPTGTRALARVLDDEGVDVQVARTAGELEAIDLDGGTSVVVVLPEYLGTSTIERLREHTTGARAVIVVGAGPGIADALGVPGGGASIPLGDGRTSGCADGRFDGLSLEVDSTHVYPDGVCYGGRAGAIDTEPHGGLLLFGADQALTNDQILRADNAAVAVRSSPSPLTGCCSSAPTRR